MSRVPPNSPRRSGQAAEPGHPHHNPSLAGRWSRGPRRPLSRGRCRLPDGPADSGRAVRSVLIADDDAFARDVLGRLLEMNGYRVLKAANGAEALQCLHRQSRPDLIILDLLMPRLNGYEFLRRRQREPGLADIPVIVVSAEDTSTAAEQVGVMAHFQKPIAFQDLLATIGRCVARA